MALLVTWLLLIVVCVATGKIVFESSAVDKQVKDTLKGMSTSEKVGQIIQADIDALASVPTDVQKLQLGSILQGGGTLDESKTGSYFREYLEQVQKNSQIPILFGIDAVHGHSKVLGATVFPHNIGLGASRDPDLVYRVAVATCKEMRATGIRYNFAPVLAAVKDIRWGRTYESFSQAQGVVSELGLSYLRGMQSNITVNGVIAPRCVATAKHFLGDGITEWGSGIDGKLDQGDFSGTEEELRALSIDPYIQAIDEGVLSVMLSYNSWNSSKVHGSKHLVTNVLKKELGFRGMVITDWEAMFQLPGDVSMQVEASVNAGADLFMGATRYAELYDVMLGLVNSGRVSESRLNDAVTRVLRVKYMMGLFDMPVPINPPMSTLRSKKHLALAREAVSKSLVLLKNKGALPINAKKYDTFIVMGGGADDKGMANGGWTYSWQGQRGDVGPGTTLLQQLKSTYGKKVKVKYARSKISPGKKNLGILVVGEGPYTEFEGDNESPELAKSARDRLYALNAVCDKVILVIYSGRPIGLADAPKFADAIVAAWLPGTEAGPGIVDVLSGKKDFSGKLPFAWPKKFDKYNGQADLKARKNVQYKFGYGLTYE